MTSQLPAGSKLLERQLGFRRAGFGFHVYQVSRRGIMTLTEEEPLPRSSQDTQCEEENIPNTADGKNIRTLRTAQTGKARALDSKFAGRAS